MYFQFKSCLILTLFPDIIIIKSEYNISLLETFSKYREK